MVRIEGMPIEEMPSEQINAIKGAVVALDDSLKKFEKLPPEKRNRSENGHLISFKRS